MALLVGWLVVAAYLEYKCPPWKKIKDVSYFLRLLRKVFTYDMAIRGRRPGGRHKSVLAPLSIAGGSHGRTFPHVQKAET